MPPTIYPTGVTIYFPDQAHPTLVLFDGRDGRSHKHTIQDGVRRGLAAILVADVVRFSN